MKSKFYLFALLFFVTILQSQSKLQLYFDFGKDVPNQASMMIFNNFFKNNQQISVQAIHSFCDFVDSDVYNKQLSERRATTVVAMLRNSNIVFAEDFETKNFGENSIQNSEQSKNRRVDLFYSITATGVDSIKPNQIDLNQKINNATVGEKLVLENLNFYNFSDVVLPKSIPILDELVNTLKQNPTINIEIQGHICCLKKDDAQIAYKRAKKNYDFLILNNINANRLSFKSFESTKPLHPIPEKNAAEEDANRRVEIEIISK